jgi:membrane protein DedA with SNARE-associated domain
VSAIVGVISATGYFGVLVLMALESACLPLPSEVIMPFAGYLVSTGELNLFWVATAGAAGCNLGSTVAYYIGAWGERRAIERFGRYLLITPQDVELAERFFQRFGSITVFVARLLPVVRSFVALPAGFAEMNMWKFQLYTFAGSWIWCFGLAYLGERLGDKWESDPSLRAWFHSADIVIGILLLVGIAWWIWRHVKGLRKSSSN